jgi:hypothetical protein
MSSSTPGSHDRKTREAVPKEWRPPELRKLPIEATAGSQGKSGAINSADGSNPKTADSSGQMS